MENKYIKAFKDALVNEPTEIGATGKQKKKKRTEEEKVVAALSIVNSMTMTGEYLKDEWISEEEKYRVLEFMDFFAENYGDNEKLCRMIEHNWPAGPRIFRIYDAILDEEEAVFEEKMLEEFKTTDEDSLYKIKPYADFIHGHSNPRHLTYLEGDLEVGHQYFLEYNDHKPETKEFIQALLYHAMTYGGIVMYRREKKNEHVVCALRCVDGCIYGVPKLEVEESMRNAPKDEDITETYAEFPASKLRLVK